MERRRLLWDPSIRDLPPRRRLRHDLTVGATVIPIALGLGLRTHDRLTGYPLTYGLTLFVMHTVVGLVRYVRAVQMER